MSNRQLLLFSSIEERSCNHTQWHADHIIEQRWMRYRSNLEHGCYQYHPHWQANKTKQRCYHCIHTRGFLVISVTLLAPNILNDKKTVTANDANYPLISTGCTLHLVIMCNLACMGLILVKWQGYWHVSLSSWWLYSWRELLRSPTRLGK